MYSKFERLVGGKLNASIILGITPDKYNRYRSDEIIPKTFIEYSIAAHSCLSKSRLKGLEEKRKAHICYKENTSVSTKKYIKSIGEKPNYVKSMMFQLERCLNLGPTVTARFLGLQYERYYDMKKGNCDTWLHIIATLETHLLIRHVFIREFMIERPLKRSIYNASRI